MCFFIKIENVIHSISSSVNIIFNTPTNKWILRAPVAHTTMFIAPMKDGKWQWGKGYELQQNGHFVAHGNMDVAGTVKAKNMDVAGTVKAKNYKWPNTKWVFQMEGGNIAILRHSSDPDFRYAFFPNGYRNV